MTMFRAIERLGDRTLGFIELWGQMGLFLLTTLGRVLRPPYPLYPVVRQIHFIGARSTLVILVAGAFTGMVVALQFHDTLVRFGSVAMLGSAVALALVRELGPVICALVVIGRAGSAICAEIGIMRTDEQIDALECMGIDPYRHLIAPRILAGIIAVPALTMMFIVVGIFGGWFVGVVLFGVGEAAYFHGMYETVVWHDVWMGLVKSVVFGLVIVWVATVRGFFLHLDRSGVFGAEGVSRTTTNAVVFSTIGVLVMDYLISAVML
jgi:phospholipid/cholesterol/gamma-HCH transport system permease protein